MKSWCCLIVFESLLNSTVDDNLVILKFPTNHSEGRVQEMVVNVNLMHQRVSKTVEFGSNISKVFIYNNGFLPAACGMVMGWVGVLFLGRLAFGHTFRIFDL